MANFAVSSNSQYSHTSSFSAVISSALLPNGMPSYLLMCLTCAGSNFFKVNM